MSYTTTPGRSARYRVKRSKPQLWGLQCHFPNGDVTLMDDIFRSYDQALRAANCYTAQYLEALEFSVVELEEDDGTQEVQS
jgi:hypothetical protein